MPYSSNPTNSAYNPSQLLPQHLAHKPVYALPYEYFDGIYQNGTDMRYISLGIAQYDRDHVSIKTMRHIGSKWTRQAEEIPIHRSIDMTLFLSKAIFDVNNTKVDIPINTLINQTSHITVSQEQCSYGELASYNQFLNINKQLYKDRLNSLRDVLNDLKKRGKI